MAEKNHIGRPASSPRIDRIRDLFERIKAHGNVDRAATTKEQVDAATAAMDALLDEFSAIAADVWRQPVGGWSDIVERALLAWHYEADSGGIGVSGTGLSHAEITRRHLLASILDYDRHSPTTSKAARPKVQIGLDGRDAIDAELEKLNWLVSIATLAGTYLEDRDPEPGGWRMMQNVAYHLSQEIAASRSTIAKILDSHEAEEIPHADGLMASA